MLRAAKDFEGYAVKTSDGETGSVADVFFDDGEWKIRYVVVDTGDWLPGRKVPVAVQAVGKPDFKTLTVAVDLTCEQIKKGPDVDAAKPISRREEESLHRWFSWIPYWSAGASVSAGPMAVPGMAPGQTAELRGVDEQQAAEETPGEGALRSAREVRGYHIHAADGEIGHVEDFLIEDDAWKVRYIVVDTRNWLPGKKVLVAPEWLTDVDWSERRVHTELARERIRNAPEFDPAVTVDRRYEAALYEHYGFPGYWL